MGDLLMKPLTMTESSTDLLKAVLKVVLLLTLWVLKLSYLVLKLTLNLSAITMYTWVKQWNSKLLKSTMNLKT